MIDLIKIAKKEIARKLNWEENHHWKQRDFEYLSEIIFKETGVLLSLSTLKRIWKKNYQGTPHPTTLNAFARFLGYEDWYNFKSKYDTPEIEKPVKSQSKASTWQKRLAVPSLIFLVVIVGGIFTFSAFRKHFKRQHIDKTVFTSKKTVTSGVPNTVIFNYDVTPLAVDSAVIQQSWDTRRRATVPKDQHFHTSVYYYPGFHKAKLMVGGEIIKQHFININTDGWLALVQHEMGDLIPFYLPVEKIVTDGRLYASPALLAANKVETTRPSYWLNYYRVQDFDSLDGDNFILETAVKNAMEEGGLTGQYCILTIMNENGRMLIPLSEPGCVGNLNVKFMDAWKLGKENDLSDFGCDMSQWNQLRCEIRNKNVVLSLNNEQILTLKYEQSAGRVIGLHYMFHGCGSVDEARFSRISGEVVFEDDFESGQILSKNRKTTSIGE